MHQQHNALLDKCDRYREDLGEVADQLSVGTALATLWADAPRVKEEAALALQERLMHWHFANIEFANAAKLRALSLRNWDQDDPYEMLGDHIFLPGAGSDGWCSLNALRPQGTHLNDFC